MSALAYNCGIGQQRSNATAKTRVRELLEPLLKNAPAVFNDPLDNGGRSIKVWGWDKSQYDAAQALLESYGYTVKQVVTPRKAVGKWYESGGKRRLHVC